MPPSNTEQHCSPSGVDNAREEARLAAGMSRSANPVWLTKRLEALSSSVQASQRSDSLVGLEAMPPTGRIPERMIRMLGTSRPARIYEGVVNELLYVIHHPLFKLLRILAEQANARDSLLDIPLMTGPDGLRDVVTQQLKDALGISL